MKNGNWVFTFGILMLSCFFTAAGLRLGGFIDYSWWLITIPIWMPVCVFLCVFLFLMLSATMFQFGKYFDERK